MKHHHVSEPSTQVDLTPMLDVIFILLIFFIVTASFINEVGITIDRPQGKSATEQNNQPLVFEIDAKGLVWFKRRQISLSAIRALLSNERATNNAKSVLINADKSARADSYVYIADAARQARIAEVAMRINGE